MISWLIPQGVNSSYKKTITSSFYETKFKTSSFRVNVSGTVSETRTNITQASTSRLATTIISEIYATEQDKETTQNTVNLITNRWTEGYTNQAITTSRTYETIYKVTSTTDFFSGENIITNNATVPTNLVLSDPVPYNEDGPPYTNAEIFRSYEKTESFVNTQYKKTTSKITLIDVYSATTETTSSVKSWKTFSPNGNIGYVSQKTTVIRNTQSSRIIEKMVSTTTNATEIMTPHNATVYVAEEGEALWVVTNIFQKPTNSSVTDFPEPENYTPISNIGETAKETTVFFNANLLNLAATTRGNNPNWTYWITNPEIVQSVEYTTTTIADELEEYTSAGYGGFPPQTYIGSRYKTEEIPSSTVFTLVQSSRERISYSLEQTVKQYFKSYTKFEVKTPDYTYDILSPYRTFRTYTMNAPKSIIDDREAMFPLEAETNSSGGGTATFSSAAGFSIEGSTTSPNLLLFSVNKLFFTNSTSPVNQTLYYRWGAILDEELGAYLTVDAPFESSEYFEDYVEGGQYVADNKIYLTTVNPISYKFYDINENGDVTASGTIVQSGKSLNWSKKIGDVIQIGLNLYRINGETTVRQSNQPAYFIGASTDELYHAAYISAGAYKVISKNSTYTTAITGEIIDGSKSIDSSYFSALSFIELITPYYMSNLDDYVWTVERNSGSPYGLF